MWSRNIFVMNTLPNTLLQDLLKQEDCRLVFTVNLFLNDIRPIDVSIIVSP